MFDIDLIQKVYAGFRERVSEARKVLNRPLTYAEKILYAHLFDPAARQAF